MPIATVNRVKLYYEVFGAGRDIALCHGYSGSHQDWAYPIAALMSHYRVVAMDQRGHGSSQAPTSASGYSIPAFAQDVRTLLGRLEVDRCCLGGHSMGGFMALELALGHPELVAALVLVDTSSGEIDMPPEHTAARLKALELARSQGMAAAFDYVATHSPMTREQFRRHPELQDISRQRALETSVDGFVHCWGAIRERAPVTHRLSQIRVPTLIVVGEEDTPFRRPAQVLKEGIPGSQLAVIPNATHSPHIEEPETFNRALRDFLRQHYPPQR